MTRVFDLRPIVAELSRDLISKSIFTRFDVSDKALSARLGILGASISIRAVVNSAGGFDVGATGINPVATRWLHDSIVTISRVGFAPDGKELQVFFSGVDYSQLKAKVLDAAKLLFELRRQEEFADYSAELTTNMYWSSGLLNFGDWIGPHLIAHYTGRQPIQSNRQGSHVRTLYSVGSILGWFKRNNVDVWGSGLIKPLTPEEVLVKKKLIGTRIHAVRGFRTKEDLESKLNWNVPDVFGDPGLLLPDLIPKTSKLSSDFVVVPHYIHRDEVMSSTSNISIADVRLDVHDVVNTISTAKAVVSSSLHGLIVAQAYGVPWVRLDVNDQPLTGRDFKFEDFYSCLSRDDVSSIRVNREELSKLDYAAIAKEASIPKLKIDLNKLRSALPISAIAAPKTGFFLDRLAPNRGSW